MSRSKVSIDSGKTVMKFDKKHIYLFISMCLFQLKNIIIIIPYKGTGGGHRVRCGYAVLSGQVKESGVRGSYMPLSGADIIYMMAVLSWTRVVRFMCVCVDVSCCVTACVGARAAAECARLRLTIPTASRVRFLVCVVSAFVRSAWEGSMSTLSMIRVS